jgi:dsRNA-specific ribonuclease
LKGTYILDFITTEILIEKNPKLDKNLLPTITAFFINKSRLRFIAEKYNILDYSRLGENILSQKLLKIKTQQRIVYSIIGSIYNQLGFY